MLDNMVGDGTVAAGITVNAELFKVVSLFAMFAHQ